MMIYGKRKALAGASAAALLLLGGVYAWSSTNQHKTNEFGTTFRDNDVTLVEDFVPIKDWVEGQEINKDISVKNNANVTTGNNAYVRISLKEFLEFENKTEKLSQVRYAVTTAGDFAKFDNQADAQAYATANGLDAPVKVTTTAFEGNGKWFIPTKAGATHGQYGKFLVLAVGDNTKKSIIDETIVNASSDASNKHQDATHGEDAYTTQTFGNGGSDINAARNYPSQVKNYPTGAGIETGKDLKDYITWAFGSDVMTLAEWENSADKGKPTAKWIVDTSNGYVYWGQALAPSTTTAQFLDSITLTQAPKNTALYYAIHTHLEAVDYNEIDTMAPPTEIENAWKSKIRVYFKDFAGTRNIMPAKEFAVSNPDLAIPTAPVKANEYFLGWATSANAAKTQTLYLPSGYDDIQNDLNAPDQKYLGYAVKSEHEIKNIQADTTLYAVYYKKLKATDAQADEFIWNDAIWRVLNTDANTSDKRLVIKVNALTEKEATGAGADTGYYSTMFREGDYYFNADGTNGYEASATKGLKQVIDTYYSSLSDKSAVQAVSLNMPDWTTYTSDGYVGTKTSPTNWEWERDYADTNRHKFYRDNRFETTTSSGTKQAFALSYGDVHVAMRVPTTLNNHVVSLLDFTDSNINYFWIRSAGSLYGNAGMFSGGAIYGSYQVRNALPVRPALYLSVN